MSWYFLSREHRASRGALFDEYDGLEEGGLKASSSYSSGIDERDNDKAMDSLKERVVFLKKVSFTLGILLYHWITEMWFTYKISIETAFIST